MHAVGSMLRGCSGAGGQQHNLGLAVRRAKRAQTSPARLDLPIRCCQIVQSCLECKSGHAHTRSGGRTHTPARAHACPAVTLWQGTTPAHPWAARCRGDDLAQLEVKAKHAAPRSPACALAAARPMCSRPGLLHTERAELTSTSRTRKTLPAACSRPPIAVPTTMYSKHATAQSECLAMRGSAGQKRGHAWVSGAARTHVAVAVGCVGCVRVCARAGGRDQRKGRRGSSKQARGEAARV